MTGTRGSLSAFYFFAGLLCGVFVGVSIGGEWSAMVAKLVSAGVIILLAFFSRRFEAMAHKHYLENWAVRRTKGKWFFVLTEYALIRGAIVFFAIAGPILPTLRFTSATIGALMSAGAVIVAIYVYLGNEAWKSCEKDYFVRALRHAAARSRIESN